MEHIFATSHYYFPILICTRKEKLKDSGELRYEALGIPFLVDNEQKDNLPIHYEHIDRPIQVEVPKAGFQCSQYYHGQCFNALIKLIVQLDFKSVQQLLEAHRDKVRDFIPIKCTCGKEHHSNSIVTTTDCFGANALNIAVRLVTQLEPDKQDNGRIICDELLKYGSNPNLIPANQQGVLDIATIEGDIQLMKILVYGGAFITTCIERLSNLKLVHYDSTRSQKKKNNYSCAHDAFNVERLELLLNEEVLMCAPDPLVSVFYSCVILKRVAKRHYAFAEKLTNLCTRIEKVSYNYLDLCKNGWEARLLVQKEVLSTTSEESRIPLYEYAVMCEQKYFCSHKYIQHITRGMWLGDTYEEGRQGLIHSVKKLLAPILINIVFPIMLFNKYILKKEDSMYAWEHIMIGVAKVPCVTFLVDIINHIIMGYLFISMCFHSNNTLTFGEVVLWLACLSQLIIEYDFMKMQGFKSYMKSKFNVLNIIIGFTIVPCGILWIIIGATDHGREAELRVVMTTRYIYALSASGLIVRLTKMLRINKTLGPLTETVTRMLQDCVTFFILMCLTVLAFSIPLYTISYQSYETNRLNSTSVVKINQYFSSYRDTLGFLGFTIFGYGATWAGTISYDSFSSFLLNMTYGIYLIALVILLLNLLIAILNTTYADVLENANREWMFSRVKELVKYRGAQPFIFPFILYLYPLYKITTYSSRYMSDSNETVKRKMCEKARREEERAEGAKQNFYLHKILKKKYFETKRGGVSRYTLH